MIRDLGQTLRAILTQTGLPAELAAAQIVFDRPTDPFNPPATSVDLFLYDIRENVELRSNEPTIQRHNGQAVIQRPALRVMCSYLVTAWPVGGPELALQEHRLLAQVLQVFSRYPTIPPPFLQGSLVGQVPPLPMLTAQADGVKDPADFWTAVGNKLRASISVAVTIGLPVFAEITAPIVTTRIAGVTPASGPQEIQVEIGGRIQTAAGDPVASAFVDLLDLGLRAMSDGAGFYSFPRVPIGVHDLRVVAVGFQPAAQSLTVPSPPNGYLVVLQPL